MKIIFIRHGKTLGNEQHKYIGVTDEGLTQNGINEIKAKIYPDAQRIITSPLKRCIETAKLIYNEPFEIYNDLREYDFGEFENKGYEELRYNKKYTEWLSLNGTAPFPVGEGQEAFSKRCCSCFREIIKKNNSETIAFVVHGGVIMAILEKYALPEKSFYQWHRANGCGYVFELMDKKELALKQLEEI